jgi:hypothetical protein
MLYINNKRGGIDVNIALKQNNWRSKIKKSETINFIYTFIIIYNTCNENSGTIKINSFIPIPHPFPSLFFPSPSLLQSYFELIPLHSSPIPNSSILSPCFVVHYSVI